MQTRCRLSASFFLSRHLPPLRYPAAARWSVTGSVHAHIVPSPTYYCSLRVNLRFDTNHYSKVMEDLNAGDPKLDTFGLPTCTLRRHYKFASIDIFDRTWTLTKNYLKKAVGKEQLAQCSDFNYKEVLHDFCWASNQQNHKFCKR